jgi:hypothetical protein
MKTYLKKRGCGVDSSGSEQGPLISSYAVKFGVGRLLDDECIECTKLFQSKGE